MPINELLDHLYVKGWLSEQGLRRARSVITGENYPLFDPFKHVRLRTGVYGEELVIFVTQNSRIAVPCALIKTCPDFYQFVAAHSE